MEPEIRKEEIKSRPPGEDAKEHRQPPKPISTKRLAVSLLMKIAAIAVAVSVYIAQAVAPYVSEKILS
ncbi:MAG: hypothetical protein ABS876_05165, partial [Ruminococcus sp.]